MTISELNDLTPEELEQTLLDKQEELSNLRFQLGMFQLNDISLMKKVKVDIARIKTLLREYELNIRQPVSQ